MKPYAKLRGKMAEMDVKAVDLADYLGKSRQYISQHLLGKYGWNIDEVYKILDLLEISKEQIVEYFPPNGGLPEKEGKKKCGSC